MHSALVHHMPKRKYFKPICLVNENTSEALKELLRRSNEDLHIEQCVEAIRTVQCVDI